MRKYIHLPAHAEEAVGSLQSQYRGKFPTNNKGWAEYDRRKGELIGWVGDAETRKKIDSDPNARREWRQFLADLTHGEPTKRASGVESLPGDRAERQSGIEGVRGWVEES